MRTISKLAYDGRSAIAAVDDADRTASIPHARFVERCLREWGVRAVAVHSEADSADRDEALKRLEQGDLDAVCSVDLLAGSAENRDAPFRLLRGDLDDPEVFVVCERRTLAGGAAGN